MEDGDEKEVERGERKKKEGGRCRSDTRLSRLTYSYPPPSYEGPPQEGEEWGKREKNGREKGRLRTLRDYVLSSSFSSISRNERLWGGGKTEKKGKKGQTTPFFLSISCPFIFLNEGEAGKVKRRRGGGKKKEKGEKIG